MTKSNDPDPLHVHIQQWLDNKFLDPAFASIFGRDDRFPHITAVSIEAALQGFPLSLAPARDMTWLAKVVRRSLALTTPNIEGMPDHYKGNGAIREKLKVLSLQAKLLGNGFDNLDNDELATLSAALGDAEWQSFETALLHIQFLSEMLDVVCAGIKVEKGKWRSSALKELRIRQAHYLAPIFEGAYEIGATYSDRGKGEVTGPWPEFFVRMLKLATSDNLTKDTLRATVKEGRTRHTDNPVSYPSTIIPL